MGSSASTPHSEPAASILWTLRTATESASVAAPTRSGVGVLYAFAPTPPLLMAKRHVVINIHFAIAEAPAPPSANKNASSAENRGSSGNNRPCEKHVNPSADAWRRDDAKQCALRLSTRLTLRRRHCIDG